MTLVKHSVRRRELKAILSTHPEVREVVFFPPVIGWNLPFLFQRPQQMARALARQECLVFFHEPPYANRYPDGFTSIEPQLYIANVPLEILDELHEPVVMAYTYCSEHPQHFRNPQVVYDYLDDLERHPGGADAWAEAHAELLDRATVVVASSTQLWQSIAEERPDALLCPNAVDYEFFHADWASLPGGPPADLKPLLDSTHPIVGYLGALAENMFNYGFIRTAAGSRADYTFVIIGHDLDGSLQASGVLSFPNVHWLGSKPYDEIPIYLAYFDIATIPLIDNQIMRAASPGKLFQYLAAGKPVVASDLPECRKYRPVLVASDAEEFTRQLSRALLFRDDPVYKAEAEQVARQNTWTARVKSVLDTLDAARQPDRRATRLEWQVIRRDRRLARLNTVVAQLESRIDSLTTEVAEQQDTVRSLSAQVTEGDQTIRGLSVWMTEKDQAIQTLEAQVDELKHLAHELDAIHTSKWWKLAGLYWGAHDRFRTAADRLSRSRTWHWLHRCLAGNGQAYVDPAGLTGGVKLPHAQGLDVICFPIIDWDFRFQRPQHLLTQFARQGHRVFYLRTRFHGLDQRKVDVYCIAERIFELGLPGSADTIIYHDDLSGTTLDRALNALREFIRQQDVAEAVCLVQHPFWEPLASALKAHYGWKIVYDCMDDHSGFETNHPAVVAHETQLVDNSDLVVATSRLLHNEMSQRNPNCLLVPNGGDYDHFSALPTRDQSPVAHLPSPVIGYYGAIAEWFDVQTVCQAAERHPAWSFVLIGYTFGSDLRELECRPNVYLLGEKPYAELPAYLAGFDVCTIPFLRTPLTEATNPVKVFEYLSAGKPVVAAALPELESLADVVYQYTTPDEFVALLEQALAEDSPSLAASRQATARQNTWKERYQVLKPAVESLYAKVSIIVVSYKGLDYIRQCMASILDNTRYPDYEVVIVDNASGEPVREYLRRLDRTQPQVRVVFNEANVGFAAANNLGIASVTDSEFIVLLNNDTVVPPGWLSRLLRYARHPDVGLVGPVTNWTGNEARIDVDYTDLADMPDFARRHVAARAGRSFDIKVLAMFCLAMRREVFDEIGPLDECFGIGMFEDDDYARRARQAGYRVVCAEDVFVHHYGEVSFSQLDEAEYLHLFNRNKQLYEEKWGGSWLPHRARDIS